MMAGSTSALQSEAGYIDARPQIRQIDENLLRRTAGPYRWVNCARSGLSPGWQVLPEQQTSGNRQLGSLSIAEAVPATGHRTRGVQSRSPVAGRRARSP